MYPPVAIGQVRVSNTHDITLGGRLHIPAGTAIWVPHHAIQNVSFNWDDADMFKPGTPVCVSLQNFFRRPNAPAGSWCSALSNGWSINVSVKDRSLLVWV